MSELLDKMLHTPDLNKERLDVLKKLFPDLFTLDGKLNPDELMGIIDPKLPQISERFDFNWIGKNESKRHAFTPSKCTLYYDELRSVNPEFADGNMIIEGENLETMKCLISAYRERIKCIYIDPPYNTGRDFLYSDNWGETKEAYWEKIGVLNDDGMKLETNPEGSGRYHSNWMSMLYPRLIVARQLLRDDGIIFISIDDSEVHHLRKMCDEIFGEINFFATLTRRAMHTVRNSSKDFNLNTDYILVYAKDKIWFSKDRKHYIRHITDKTANYPHDDNDGRGFYKLDPLHARNYYKPYHFKFSNGKKWFPPTGSYPRYSEEKLAWMEKENRIVFSGNEPKAKRFLNEVQEGQPPDALLSPDVVGFNSYGTSELREIFEQGGIFPQPKPTKLIKFLLGIIRNKDCIVLDFFAGSGTTAHAILSQNKIDGGNRKFILIQIAEITDPESEANKAGYKKISDITIERNKRVIQRMLSDGVPFKAGFKVYKLGNSNFPRVNFQPNPSISDQENLKLLEQYISQKEALLHVNLIENFVFDEVLLKKGFMLNYSKNILDDFAENAVYLVKDKFKKGLICLDLKIEKDTLKTLENFRNMAFICLEKSLTTTTKWNLRHKLGDKLIVI